MIQLSKPNIGSEELEGVCKVLKSGRLSLGPKIDEFEKNFSRLIGTKYAIAVNSGTSGLHLCIKSLGIKDGDEVITSPFSFVSSANCMLFERAKPVFVDIDKESFNINPDLIEEKITDKTKAILPVHVFGQSCDMDPIVKIAKKHNLKIIEDACESILATYKGKNVGTFGDVGVFAFYPNKQMTTGEGGMIVTSDKKIYELCKSYRNQGRSDDTQWLVHDKIGYNYRMPDINAALGIVQLSKLKQFVENRRILAMKYINALKDIKEIELPKVKSYNEHTWFVFQIHIDEKIRDNLIKELKENKIQSKAYFYPCIHLQPIYKKIFGYEEEEFPIAERISKRTLILPFHHEITEKDIRLIKNILIKGVEGLK